MTAVVSSNDVKLEKLLHGSRLDNHNDRFRPPSPGYLRMFSREAGEFQKPVYYDVSTERVRRVSSIWESWLLLDPTLKQITVDQTTTTGSTDAPAVRLLDWLIGIPFASMRTVPNRYNPRTVNAQDEIELLRLAFLYDIPLLVDELSASIPKMLSSVEDAEALIHVLMTADDHDYQQPLWNSLRAFVETEDISKQWIRIVAKAITRAYYPGNQGLGYTIQARRNRSLELQHLTAPLWKISAVSYSTCVPNED